MRKIVIFYVAFLIFCKIALAAEISENAGTTAASFLKIGLSARAVAMGESYAAISDGINSLYWNPAGLAKLELTEVTFTHNIWLEGISHEYVAYGQPLLGGGAGVGLIYLTSGNIGGRDIANEPIGDISITDTALIVAYGHNFGENFSAGLGVKLIQENIAGDVISASVFDFGSLILLDNISIGCAVQNAGTGVEYTEGTENLPQNIRLGTAFYLLDENLLMGIDINQPSDESLKINIGAEYLMSTKFNLRMGYSYSSNNSVLGGLAGFSTGFGLNFDMFSLDLAFVPYGNLGSSFQVSLTGKF